MCVSKCGFVYMSAVSMEEKEGVGLPGAAVVAIVSC